MASEVVSASVAPYTSADVFSIGWLISMNATWNDHAEPFSGKMYWWR